SIAICVSDPMGALVPRRMLSTPAMNVVATAPSPGVRMPSLPVAGRMDSRVTTRPSGGGEIHVTDPLEHRHPGGDREKDDEEHEHATLQREAEERRWGRQERDPLGTLQPADLRIDAERFGARAGVRSEEGAND